MTDETRTAASGGPSGSDGPSKRELDDLVAKADTGARNPRGPIGLAVTGIALAWALFQLYIASPLPFLASQLTGLPLVLNDAQIRPIHLGFALFLAYCAYPAFSRSPRDRIPILDLVLAAAATYCALYIFIFYREISARPGLPTTADLAAAGAGLVLLLEATRRALGPPLAIVAIVFLLYVFFGSAAFLPDVIQWGGASFSRAMDQMWLTSGGVFGVALGVSASFVFLFVLFGSLLDKAGAGNFFIKLAFALLGHLRGGPAKAAVLSSMMTGLISGSSIANVVTTGTFTIPLMKRVGFSAEKAGSVEVASSVNGQIMPPVMGAAAFLMVEYVGIPYTEVITHAFLPAVISYIALLYLVHLEALKNAMPALPKRVVHPLPTALLRAGITIASIVILAGLVYVSIRGVQAILPSVSTPVLLALVAAIYVGLIWLASKGPDLEIDDPDAPVLELPIATEVLKTGLHYILPIVVLVWFLMIEQRSPGLSAFYAVVLLVVILLTQKPLKALFRRVRGAQVGAAFREGVADLTQGLILGSRNMIGIACATATAGIIVGAVTLTGIGQVMAEFVEFLSGGNILLILVFTALISLVLGMGLPTTANYIVVATLMAPVIVELGQANGIIIPLIAAHLFVFYFGIMADVTPPVGLASFAAAAVSRGDPLKTGFTAFFYSLRTVLLPFIFVFNTNLLLIDVGWVQGIWVFLKATAAMLVFAAATQAFFLVRNRIWETVALLLVAFLLLRPGFLIDQIVPPYEPLPAAQVEDAIAGTPEGGIIRIGVSGPRFSDLEVEQRTLAFTLPDAALDPATRLEQATGLVYVIEGERVLLEEPFDPRSPGGRTLGHLDFYDPDNPVVITAVEVPVEQPARAWSYLPAALLFGLVWLAQSRRARRQEADRRGRETTVAAGSEGARA
ncbi:TRAP transporter permease [Salinarimonas rosea]|uniref:TRAP transporter permease n=1 Tax=Salinarimonas rosea TaxID=552063 RepID=UPI00041694EB|nr:TRAP transporter permease [Salinarimonas rosea]